jgi:uncharacterized protein DUF3617
MRTVFAGLIILSSVAVGAADQGQPLNVKTGLWEVSRTMTRSGSMPIPPELLQRLSPEQRARLEERMKAQSGEQTKTTTYQTCLTKEELQEGPTFNEEKYQCSRNILNSTSSKIELRLTCEQEGINGNGTIQIEALSPESVKGSVHIVANGGGKTMNSNSSFSAKWIASSCAGMK